MRNTILIQGARENNLRNVTIEIPRQRLIVVTGVSGSGKSSLAFDTLYAEAQRRLLDSMSAFAKRFVSQLKKPDVDFVYGLSPVISIDQKTVTKNPRSTVGTMTDIHDYLRMLYATVGEPRCPVCEATVPSWSLRQMVEHILALPDGAEVEIRAPTPRIYGEDYAYLFEMIRAAGYRRVRIDGKLHDLGEEIEMDESRDCIVEAVVDVFVVQRGIDKLVRTALEHGLKVGDGFFSFHLNGGKVSAAQRKAFGKGFGCKAHAVIGAAMHHGWFTFNDASGACPTCNGLGTSMRVHTPFLVPDPSRSLNDGAIVKEALSAGRDSWGGRILASLSARYGIDLDKPFSALSEKEVKILFYGTGSEKFKVVLPKGAKAGGQHEGKDITFQGVVNQIERNYARYRKHGTAENWAEEWFRKMMVEHPCPECRGMRLKKARRLVTVNGLNLSEIGDLDLEGLRKFIDGIKPGERHRGVFETIQREVNGRLGVLIDIGLNYLNLNRASGTLSGGESQRIRLASQIGSGLMGMLYVLDEPSIGLHPKDNEKMIATLKQMRDIGNTVVVVEHDEDTMRAGDFIVEMGPGAGVHGGEIVAAGPLKKILAEKRSLTGQFLSGRRSIDLPAKRRTGKGKHLSIRGARHNNLNDLDIDLPLGVFTCITGASGSGKSSLIHEILYKKLFCLKYDSRVIAGEHDELLGHDLVDDVIHIDQSPIGRSPRSNPATYIGFYDNIRQVFAETEMARNRGYTSARFSFNVKGGRCEDCAGDGVITTKLSFMPDVEVTCPACKGRRYNDETLEVTYNGRDIAEVLDMSIEEGSTFFANESLITRKLSVLNELGLGYLDIGCPATILSGGEAQRIKLAAELGKIKHGRHNLYILDEPTTGLHFADIQRLLDCLNQLVDRGHSVVVIEHNLDVIKTADHVIDLGPEGGHNGGKLLVAGTPEEVARVTISHTGRFLQRILQSRS